MCILLDVCVGGLGGVEGGRGWLGEGGQSCWGHVCCQVACHVQGNGAKLWLGICIFYAPSSASNGRRRGAWQGLPLLLMLWFFFLIKFFFFLSFFGLLTLMLRAFLSNFFYSITLHASLSPRPPLSLLPSVCCCKCLCLFAVSCFGIKSPFHQRGFRCRHSAFRSSSSPATTTTTSSSSSSFDGRFVWSRWNCNEIFSCCEGLSAILR